MNPVPFFDLKRQFGHIEQDLRTAIDEVLDSQHFIMGGHVSALEDELARICEVPHVISCASGTDALLLPLKGLGLDEGAHVLVPSFTFFATAGAVSNAGLEPVFCDVDPGTFNMTRETLEAAWTPETRAIVVVHLFGQMAPMKEIMALAEERGAAVIEDFAQAFGASQEIDGVVHQAGSLGLAGSTSFFPTKNLGAFGDGGLVTVTDEALAEYVGLARTHGGRRMYHHEFVGTNSRLDALQASILLAKLRHLDGWLEKRRANADMYDRLLDGVGDVATPVRPPENTHTFNQYTIRTKRRDELQEHLKSRGIGSKVYYPVPLHRQACFEAQGERAGALPVSEQLCHEVLSLPVFPELGESEVCAVAEGVRSFF